jgi:uncharacterized repeat protein (TIGR01451 family)
MTTNHGSTVYRNSPDVALTAIGIYQNYGDGQVSDDTGGTSAASPLWAGFNAMINQQATLYNMPPDGFINPAIYALAKGPGYLEYFHDITVGNNIWPGSPTNFYAVSGYDLCTGWGTPTGSNIINALAPPLNIPILLVVTDSVTGGNGSGIISYDECVNLTFLITNAGVAEATGIQGYLYSATYGAIVAQSIVSFPDLPPGTAAYSTTSFSLSTEPSFICGTPVDLVLVLKDDQGSQTNNLQLPTGVIGPPDVFSNETPFVIPQGSFTGIFSPVTVSNLAAAAKITVSVYASVEYDEGLSLELISPSGSNVTLTVYPNGYLGANYGAGCSSSLQTTFDDDALTAIAAGSAPFLGTYQPEQPLSSLLPCSGTNLNGVWKLNAVEEFTGDPSTLVCWSLNIEPYVCQDGGGQCPGSDLSLTMTATPNPVLVFSNVVFNLNVSNAGPSSANAVAISQSLPPGFSFIGTSNYPVQVTDTGGGTNLSFSLGALPVYGTALLSVITVPNNAGFATSVATVGLTGTDPNLNNNTAYASTLVTLPNADLAVSMTASPTTLLQGGLVTYTVVVTNNGPFTATGVVLGNTLPANATYVSSTTSQGAIALDLADSLVTDNLGVLPTGSNAVFTVTVSPTSTGNITDTAQVSLSGLETDPVLFNNTASFTVTVGPSADLGITAVVTPATVIAGHNYTNIATVVNNGPSAAIDVVFNQTIPGGTGLNAATWVSSYPTNVTVTNGNIAYNIGSMSNGAVVFITNVLKAPTIQAGGRPIILSSTFSVFGQPGDANTNNNVVTVSNIAETPTITIVPAGAMLVSQSGGFTNGAINPGATVGIELYLQNTGNIPATSLVGTLQASGGVSLPGGSQNYGTVAPGAVAPVGGYFSFLASGTNGGTVVATLNLTNNSTNLGTVAFTFYFPTIQTFWNTNLISIPATNFVPEPDSGPGSPYPSTIQISNVAGYVSKVTVTVSNLNHTYPNDIGLLLVGPATNAVLMDAAAAHATQTASNIDLVFDSTAALILPSLGNLTSGTFQPADYNSGDVFTNALVSGGTNVLSPPYSANLASFNGLAAKGAWSLYAHDNAVGDAGAISNGWAVTITTVTPVNPTNSLTATFLAATSQVVVGNLMTNIFSVTNYGATAVSAYLTNILPSGLYFVSGSLTNYTQNGQTNIYNLGSLNPGAGVLITNVDQAVGNGLQTNTITAGLPFAAFNVGNNSATAITVVTLPVANLAAGLSVAPNPAIAGSALTYTLSVTNLGPSNSLATTGSFSLTGPISASFTTNFGLILPGYFTQMTLTNTPTNAGVLTCVWSVTNSYLASNSVSEMVTVSKATPIIAAAGAMLVSQSGGFANGAINPGETVIVDFTLANVGTTPTTKLLATLQASGGITPVTTSQNYGAVPPGGSSNQQFAFTASGASGANVTAALALVDVTATATNSLGNVSYAFQIPVTTNYASSSFSSAAGIIIPEFGPGTPYPSVIQVSGLTNAQGGNLLVGQVTVTLNGFAHTFPHDVNVLLDSPSGQEMIIMGHAGGAYGVSNLNLTFKESATQSLPASPLTNGNYLPTDYPPADVFPDFLAAPVATNLGIFNGMSANGAWSLYVYDDSPGNAGAITGGWSLGLTAVSTVNPAALLAASMISSPDPVLGGNYLSYLITVTNQGPDIANDVVITDTLPAGVTFSSAALSQGANYVAGNGTVVCYLGSISNAATATATITVIAGLAGTIVNTATVSTASADLYLAAAATVNSTSVDGSLFDLKATNSADGLQLTLLGQAGQTYVIQTSTNLVNWTSVYTNAASFDGSSFIYTDTSTNAPLRFYRAIHAPQ